MATFKDKAIVIKVKKIWEKDLLYTLFSYEYGKIMVSKKFNKKEKNIDLWYIINFEITTKENISIHKIKNVKIFFEINFYLEILSLILRETIDWVQNKEIFWIIELLNKKEKIDEIKLILAKIKIKFLFWILWIEHKNQTIEKILKFSYNHKINDIFKLTWINEDLKNILEKL